MQVTNSGRVVPAWVLLRKLQKPIASQEVKFTVKK